MEKTHNPNKHAVVSAQRRLHQNAAEIQQTAQLITCFRSN